MTYSGISMNMESTKSYKINGRKLFSSFLSLISNVQDQINNIVNQGTQLNLFNIASSVFDLTDAIKLNDNLEDQLSSMIQKGYQSAVLEILCQYQEYFKIKQESWEISGFIEDFKAQMNALIDNMVKVDITFFDKFIENEIVCILSDSFSKYLGLFCDIDSTRISKAFKDSFLKCIVLDYCSNFEKYNLLPLYYQNPFQTSVKENMNWMVYRQKLIDFMNTKLYFDDFCLNDIYIELCGYYCTITTSIGNKIKTIVNTQEWLHNWIADIKNENNIMLISGKPASGKTTLLKKIASELAADNQKVIWIPLKYFNFSPEIHRNIIEYCEQELGHNPLQGIRDDEKLILLFDGLDEIALKGAESLERSRNFIEYIKKGFETKSNVKIIISGRNLVIRENSNLFIGNDNIQYVLDIMPLYMDEEDCEGKFNSGCELMVDKRPMWWKKYAVIRNKKYTDTPNEIIKNLSCTNSTFLEITSEPFLLYLLAISYEDKILDYSKRLSINKLYHHFVGKIYHSTWNKYKRSAANAEINEEQFYIFLKEVGLCSWQTGNREIPIDMVKKKCRKIGFTDVLNSYCADKNISENIAGLMLLFYIDRSSDDLEKSFEFSHKSFGEYFAGVKIADIMLNLFKANSSPKDIFTKLSDIFQHQYLDQYVTEFVTEELSIIGENDPEKLVIMQDNLAKIFPALIESKISLQLFIDKDDKSVFRNIRNVEKSVYILLCSIGKLTKKRAMPPFSSMTQFCEWINKEICFIGIHADIEAVIDYSQYISYLEFHIKHFEGIYLNKYVLENNLFDNINFDNSSMLYSQIYNCEFVKCDFWNTNFSRSSFEDVIFNNCIFNGSHFLKNTFKNVTFINCKFDCIVKFATFESVIFEENYEGIFTLKSSFNDTQLKIGKTIKTLNINNNEIGLISEMS